MEPLVAPKREDRLNLGTKRHAVGNDQDRARLGVANGSADIEVGVDVINYHGLGTTVIKIGSTVNRVRRSMSP